MSLKCSQDGANVKRVKERNKIIIMNAKESAHCLPQQTPKMGGGKGKWGVRLKVNEITFSQLFISF